MHRETERVATWIQDALDRLRLRYEIRRVENAVEFALDPFPEGRRAPVTVTVQDPDDGLDGLT